MTNRPDFVPPGHRLSDAELALAVSSAIINDKLNPGSDLPFQIGEFAGRLGIRDRHAARPFLEANPGNELNFRVASYCWQLVVLGYLVPDSSTTSFRPTDRGRRFFESADPTAVIPGGLDAQLAQEGFGQTEAPRQYARLAQDCFLAGHYETATVMLGVANEALLVDLAVELSRSLQTLATPFRPYDDRATARGTINWIRDSLEAHRRTIRQELESRNHDSEWIEVLRDTLDGTSQAIRLTRNDFGHPTGLTASLEDALQVLTLFPRFARASHQAISALRTF